MFPRPVRVRVEAAVALAVAAGAAWPGATGAADRVRSRLADDPVAVTRACVQQEMAAGRLIGVSVAVMRDGEVVMSEGFGRKHRDRTDTVDAATQFRIGSTTKMLTAAGVLRLVDRGLVDLDAPLARYVPEVRFAEPGFEDRVTIRDLLQHTSGLPDNSATQESDLYGKPDPAAMGRWVLAQGATIPHNPPGRFWNYSSANYMYLGHVIERVSGLGFPAYMEREVFAPAGMRDTTMLAGEVEARGDFAFGHWNDIFNGGLAIWRPSDQDNWARHPTGYAHSTASDLVRWATVLMDGGGDVLTEASAHLMTSPLVAMMSPEGEAYGFGVISQPYRNLALKRHPGSAWGWMATLDWVPEQRFAVATLTNGFGALYGSATCAIDAFLTPGPSTSPRPSCPQRPDEWHGLAGRYEGRTNVGTPWSWDVALVDGVLTATVARADGRRVRTAMAQDCGLADASGPRSFRADTDGNGSVDQVVTFIDDPVEPGVVWIRNRFFVLRRGGQAGGAAGSVVHLPYVAHQDNR